MKKRLLIFGFTFLLLLAVVACGTGNQVEDNGHNKTENQKEEKNDTKINNENDNEQVVINDLGIYVGQADPHTVEIETNEGPKAFQLTKKSTEQVKKLQPDDKVKFQYIVNDNKQNVLQSIEKMKGTNGNAETGIYNGQQDPHTIEIETADGPTAFQLSDEARKQVEQLQEGKKVSYTYRVEGSQLIIESIKQAE